MSSLRTNWLKRGPTNDPAKNAHQHLKRFGYIFRGHDIHPPLGFEAGKEEISAIMFLTAEEGYLYLGTPEALPTDRKDEDVQRPLPGHVPASRS